MVCLWEESFLNSGWRVYFFFLQTLEHFLTVWYCVYIQPMYDNTSPHCLHYAKALAHLHTVLLLLAIWAVYSLSVHGALPVLTPTDSLWHWEVLDIRQSALTGAKLRLMTRSQTYRAPWTAAKWLCFSLWGNSLLSLMRTVVVGYWGLARLSGLGGKRGLAGNGLRLGAKLKMYSGLKMRC